MNGIIRKISIGLDYKNSAMHYIIGQDVLGGKYKIHQIMPLDDGSVGIYIINRGEIVLWKSFNSSVPMYIEYNINF